MSVLSADVIAEDLKAVFHQIDDEGNTSTQDQEKLQVCINALRNQHQIVSKDILEKTRLGKVVNNIRKKIANEDVKKQLKELLKQWQRDYLRGSNSILQNGDQMKRKFDDSNNVHDGDSQETEPKRIKKSLSDDTLDVINKPAIACIQIPRVESLPIIKNDSTVSTAMTSYGDNINASAFESAIENDNSDTSGVNNDLESLSPTIEIENKTCASTNASKVDKSDSESNDMASGYKIPIPSKVKELNMKADVKRIRKQQASVLDQLLNSISELETQAENNYVRKRSLRLRLDWGVKDKDINKIQNSSNENDISNKVDGVCGRYAFDGSWCTWNIPMPTPNDELVILPYTVFDYEFCFES
ncbi:Mediator of RNA polymerase II transcription subunit 26 [Trichoplax sp. H2]|nr:Mediator of RNA polymerase II transcription subunit 26 [Trichoplax sp. H2]|eukprot:RDD39760.1 Mediator of RNA polymerase II transcription subunit 26 [Trichoplax sp. H2]